VALISLGIILNRPSLAAGQELKKLKDAVRRQDAATSGERLRVIIADVNRTLVGSVCVLSYTADGSFERIDRVFDAVLRASSQG